MLDWYIALFVDSTYPHTKREKGMKDKEKKKPLIDIKLTEEDIKISLLELKRRVGAPKIDFRRRK